MRNTRQEDVVMDIRRSITTAVVALVLISLSGCDDLFRAKYDIRAYSNGEEVNKNSKISEGAKIDVCWSTSKDYNNNSSSGSIRLYKEGAGDSNYIGYKSTYRDRSGCFEFYIDKPGRYQFRYVDYYTDRTNYSNYNYNNSGYYSRANTDVFTVVRGEYPLVVRGVDIEVGQSITVSWDAPESASISGDWIGLYSFSSSYGGEYFLEDWRYIYRRDFTRSEEFVVENSGMYVFMYHKNRTDEVVGESKKFFVR